MIRGVLSGLFFLSLSGAAQSDTANITATDSARWNHTSEARALQPETAGPVYKLKPAVDIPLTLVAGGWSGFAFTKVYSKDPSSPQTIQQLRPEDINGFDRWAYDIYLEKAADASDLLFYGSMPLPVVLFLDKKIRKDAGKVAFLYLEAMSSTGLLYTGSTFLFDRYRPYTYNPAAPMDMRVDGGAKNSFFAGHVALVGTATFFVAKVFNDYHPESKARWAFFTGAGLATAATGYLRHRGGRHFPSDVLLGTAVGTLSGILVPHFHKNPLFKNKDISLMPFTGLSHGLSFRYRL
jgi:membrane-associated phospholipid phosphatase